MEFAFARGIFEEGLHGARAADGHDDLVGVDVLQGLHGNVVCGALWKNVTLQVNDHAWLALNTPTGERAVCQRRCFVSITSPFQLHLLRPTRSLRGNCREGQRQVICNDIPPHGLLS